MLRFIAPALSAAFFLTLASTPVSAKPVIWWCEMAGLQKPYQLPPQYLVSYDAEAGKAEVIDGLIKTKKGQPIPVSVRERGEKVTFSWTINRLNSTNGTSYSLGYDLTVVKKTLAANVTQRVLGYDNKPDRARGSCAVKTNARLKK
jgi:hypothetical protein